MKARCAVTAIVCVAVFVTGCQTMRPVEVAGPEPLGARVAPNDFVRVWMRDGRTLDLRLTAVEADALVAGEQRIPLKDVQRLERGGFSWVRTTLLVVGLAAVVFGILVATSPVGSAWQ